MAHARAHKAAHSLAPDDLTKMVSDVSYITPIIGALAARPNVTSKDVVKAVSDSVADGKATASKAVEFLSKLPTDPDELRPFLKSLYAQNMTMLVHLKAAMIKNMAPPQAMPAPGGPMPPAGSPPGPVAPMAAPSGPMPGAGP